MVKIHYNGAMASGNSAILGFVTRGKIYNVDSKTAKKLVLNPDYTIVEDKPKEIIKETKVKTGGKQKW